MQPTREPSCPVCEAAPPERTACDACESEYAPFRSAGACPRCALVWPRLLCAGCGAWTPLSRWLPAGHPRAAFLARLEGRDPEDGLKAAAARWIGAELPPTPDNLLVARATLLECEEVLTAAEAGREELEALAGDEAVRSQGKGALAAARAASRSALEKARTALVEARRSAEQLGRRALAAGLDEASWSEARPVAAPPDVGAAGEEPGGARQLLDELSGLWARGRAALRADDGAKSFAAHDWASVVGECTAVLARDPRRARALLHRGAARRYLGELDGARADLDAALSLPGLPPAVRAWGLCERVELRVPAGELEPALAETDEAEGLAPDHWRPPQLRAWVRIERDDLQAALADLDAAVARASALGGRAGEHVLGWLLAFRASLHAAREEWAGVERDASAALEAGYRTGSVYLHRSAARLRAGRHAEARDDATRALRLAPAQGSGWIYRAWAGRLEGDLDSLRDIERLRRRDPLGEQSGAQWVLAIGAHLAGEPRRARAILRAGLARAGEAARMERATLAAWLALLCGEADALDALPPEGWAGALVRFARGELDPGGLLAAAEHDGTGLGAGEIEGAGLPAGAGPDRGGISAAAEEGGGEPEPGARTCQALGLLGLRAELEGREEEARERYAACVETGVIASCEHAWAQLRLLGVAPAVLPPGPPGDQLIARLERLAALEAEGVIGRSELERLKERLLGGGAAPPG